MAWSHPAFAAVSGFLGQYAGLSFAASRAEAAELGIRRAMERAGISSPEDYSDQIKTNTDLLADLVAELTVGETYFFREPAQFAFIRQEVLPDLRRRQHGLAVIRAWSSGCASGEEAYSLAMLLEEEGFGEHSFLLATDLSRTALARARRARYSAWSLRGQALDWAGHYLQRSGNDYVVADKIRRRVRFELLNLAQDVYPSAANGTWGMNLILCRNVLIYFELEAIRATARRLYETLAPGGWLLTASSDPPLGAYAPFETVVARDGIFYRRKEGLQPDAGAQVRITLEPLHVPVVQAARLLADPASQRAGPAGVEAPLAQRDKPVGSLDRREAEQEPSSTPTTDPLADARDELARGNYARACELTRNRTDEAGSVLHIEALANLDLGRAEMACAAAVAQQPLSAELQYLHAVLFLALGQDEQAIRALRRVLYLDRTLAVAHFTLAGLLQQRGDLAGAYRAYRNARELSAAQPPDEVVPLSDGERAGALAEVAAACLRQLEAQRRTRQ